MKISFVLFMIIIYMIIISTAVYSSDDEALNNSDGFRILFWSYPEEIEDVLDLTYPQLMKKIKVDEILTEDYILKYYWDEQLLEFDLKKYHAGAGYGVIGMRSSFFTIVLNKEIIYHGISALGLFSLREKYGDSNYPAITDLAKKNKGTDFLVLQPHFYENFSLQFFDEKEKKKILNQKVLQHFEKSGKIIRGIQDLNELLGYETFPEWSTFYHQMKENLRKEKMQQEKTGSSYGNGHD